MVNGGLRPQSWRFVSRHAVLKVAIILYCCQNSVWRVYYAHWSINFLAKGWLRKPVLLSIQYLVSLLTLTSPSPPPPQNWLALLSRWQTYITASPLPVHCKQKDDLERRAMLPLWNFQSWAETSTFLKTNFSIVILVIGFRQEDKSGLVGLLLSISSVLTNTRNVSFVCRVYLSVIVDCCSMSSVGCSVLAVDCRMSFRLLLLVPGCRVSVVGCCLSVSVVAHFFRCRCPALKLTREYVLNTILENSPPSNYSSLKKVSSDVLCLELTTLAGTTRSFNPSLQHFERLFSYLAYFFDLLI
jgi:hypothetical protein